MAHAQQLEFVQKIKAAFPESFASARTLEIGSLDINGSIRQFFGGGTYIGIDVGPGPGVDVVCQGQDYDGPPDSFDTVISCEVMEHNPHWKETMANMIRLCRPGGLILMTCATIGRKEHGTTRSTVRDSPLSVGIGWEYYKNLAARDFKMALPLSDQLAPFKFFTNWESRDLYMAGFKRGAPPPANAQQKLTAMQRFYLRTNIRYGLKSDYLKFRLLISLVGEERYWSGPVRLW